MLIPDLIAEWPEVVALFDTPDLPWRPVVLSWPVPWRKLWGKKAGEMTEAGMSWIEAEKAAYEEVLQLRANPRTTARQLVGGGAVRRDPRPMPPMPRRRITKKIRDGGGGLFDGLDDGNERSTTYEMESMQ